ncbi:MAG: PQQ-dependent sugar dehydrogenase, partial [Gemmatimonadetes bacterium]|nr:PQQ-dependent sugar dehydrogenase [Gemmatimonadota bacterium]
MRLTLRIRPLRVLLAVAAVVVTAFLFRGQLMRLFMRPEPPPEQERGISLDDTRPGEVTTIATGLDVPWSLAFLPEGGLLVTERSGRLVHIVDGERRAEVTVPGVRQRGESGLMGLALHPRFAENAWIYLAF